TGVKYTEPVASDHCKDPPINSRWMALTVWIVLGALVLTHHMTSFCFDGLLLSWAVTDVVMQRTPLLRSKLVRTAVLGLVLGVVNSGNPGNPVVTYLSGFFRTALSELGHVLEGTGKTRQLFVSYGGYPLPMWERMLVASSI